MSLRPTFMGFETMNKALSAAQKALDITGSNISNVNSLGYSRQRLDLLAINTPGGGLRYDTAIPLAGQGVGSSGVAQIRDAFLDKRYRELNSDSAMSGTAYKVLTDIENVLDCIDTAGFNEAYTKFKDSLSQFTVDSPNRVEMANATLNYAQQMVSTLKSYDTKLNQIQSQTEFELKTGADRVSEILRQISEINKQVTNSYISSGDIIMDGNEYSANTKYGPNELKDQRNSLLDELSSYGNIKVYENDNGSIKVDFANVTVVDDQKYSSFKVEQHSTGAWKVYTETQGGIKTDVSADLNGLSSGSIRGYLDMLNGAGNYAKDISIRKDGVNTQLSEVNDILDQIKKIADANPANKTTQLTDLQTKLSEYGSFTVDTTTGETLFNGVPVIKTNGSGELEVTNLKVQASDDNSSLVVKAGNTDITFAANDEAKINTALNQSEENNFDSNSQGIVYYKKVIDALANTMARTFNKANSDTDTIDPVTGKYVTRPMFEPSGDNDEITAANISVSKNWTDDPMMIAYQPNGTGSVKPDMTELDPKYLNKLKKIFTDKLSFTIDSDSVNSGDKIIDQSNMTIDQYVSYWSNNLGQGIAFTKSVYDAADSMASNIADQRDSVMGVSIDEEGTNMMNFQKWYNASARMMTTLDEALDTIISKMGLVGR